TAPSVDRYGLPSQNQLCTDGDASCDFKPETPGVCEFHVQVCFNNADPRLPACAPAGIGTVKVLSPRVPTSRISESTELAAANLGALQKGLTHLRDPRSAGGYEFQPPLEASQQGFCSAPFAIVARAGSSRSRASVRLKTRSTDGAQPSRHLGVSQ